MDTEKTLTWITLSAALIGLLVIAYAISSGSIPATSKGYTEVYFEKPTEIPETMKVGKKYIIPFVVNSNEKKTTSYNYVATLDGTEVSRGRFTLEPGEKKTVSIEINPASPSWKPSSNTSQRVVDNFTMGEVFIREGRDGSVDAYPLQFNKSRLEGKGLMMLPLNQEGTYSSETKYEKSINGSKKAHMASSMRILKNEIYMEHSAQSDGHNFSWSNLIQLPESMVTSTPIVWLTIPKGDYPSGELQSGSIVYSNVSIDFKTGLPGDIYLIPSDGVSGRYTISFSSTNATAKKVEYVEKNATIIVGGNGVSFEKVISGRAISIGKIKLSIVLTSDAGKSYEIHHWSYLE